MNCFIVACHNKAFIYQYDTFKPLGQIDISLDFLKNQGVEILDINLSKDETYLLIIVGKKISNMAFELTNMLLYEQDKNKQNYFFRYLRKLPE